MERGVAKTWRSANARYNLTGVQCTNCKTAYFPPRMVCAKCGRDTKMVEKKFSGRGVIYSYTRIFVPPHDFTEEAPYTVAIIRLEEGPLVEGHLVDGKKPEIGASVRAVFRRMYTEGSEGLIHYHFKFEIV